MRQPKSQVFDVFLLDDSKSGGKTLDLKVSLFADDQALAGLRAEMKGLEKSSTSATFFGLQATKNEKGYTVQSSKDFFWVQGVGSQSGSLEGSSVCAAQLATGIPRDHPSKF